MASCRRRGSTCSTARLRIRGECLGRGIDANAAGGPVAAALMLLQQLGTSGDDD